MEWKKGLGFILFKFEFYKLSDYSNPVTTAIFHCLKPPAPAKTAKDMEIRICPAT